MRFKLKMIALAIVGGFFSMSAANACNEALTKDSLQACSQDPDWLVRYAASLNVKKRYTEAADLLEGVLMQYPDAKGAVDQYNKALAGLDNQNKPQIQPIQPDIPPQQWQINTGLQLRSGYSDNLNQAPSQPTLQLTLPSGPVAVELQSQFRKQAGFGVESQLTANAMRTMADGLQWQVRGEFFNRETEYGGYADYQGVNLLSSLMQHEDDGRETGGALGFNVLRYGGDVYLYAGQLMLRHTAKKGQYCRPQIGGDFLWQRQDGRPLLDSRYTGLMAGVICDTKVGLYSAVVSAGWDWATSERPGGDQQRGKLEVIGIWPTDFISQDSFVKAYTNIFQSNDMQAYSPWLGNGASRYINRIGLGLDYDWPLSLVADNWRGVASVKWQNQNSNISLFEMNTMEGWLGVRVAW
ncbi:hypothetical protein [Candidatus Methylobacter oryzae]|uniref:Tetratricopeptide repeat protein n=1 Tax=Candidatus Methylobacter oryzae TaxID=2497749 RepID=A0ABY3C815_9GAMM|nr:hypothetical protein [Candidatus Methylobacter oryzae]TRW92021.1 hypothetical protein EKO24_016180 [Candidatus Methylobacter oryzae]